jgi:serine/threonine protein kinase
MYAEKYGRYQIQRELGSGTMGMVYLAHDPHIDRPVALKVLRSDRVVSEEFEQRFLKEARAIGRLSHPNIVVVYDVGRDHGTIYIAMEYLEGNPFNEIIEAGRPEYAQWAEVGAQLAETLAYAHQKGIIHRDVKPSNIIMTHDERVKLTDFGIARIEDPSATLQTQAGEILGTPVYMSPEQVIGQAVDGRSDLFSLGVVLYEWLLGQRPFRGDNLAAIFRAITNMNPPAPYDLDPFLPQGLSELLLRCLEKPIERRFQSGQEMAAALRAGIDQPSFLGEVQGPPRKARWRLSRLFLGALGFILLGVLGYLEGPRMIQQMWLWINPMPPPVEVPLETTPQPQPEAALNVISDPSGAQIFIDNNPKGITPANLLLPVGKYEVKISLPDYGEWKAQVQLTEQGVPLHVKLVPMD